MFLYLLFLFSLWAEPVPVNSVLLEQEIIPMLQGKVQSTQVKIAAKENYFAGKGTLQEGFWDWSTAPLLSPSFIQSQLIVLQQEKMEQEGIFFAHKEIDAPEAVQNQYLSLQAEYLNLIRREQNLKEQLLLRLLHNIPEEDVYKKTEHSLVYYSNILKSSIKEDDRDLIVRVSFQEGRSRELKKVLVLHFTLPKSAALRAYLQEELSLAELAQKRLEVNGCLERLLLIEAIETDPKTQAVIASLQKKENEFILTEKKNELLELQNSWEPADFSEQELRSLERQLEKKNQDLDREKPLQELQYAINQLKLERIQQYFEQQMELESKKIEEELLVSQEKLEEARKEKEENQALQLKIVSIREQETKIRTEESKRRDEFLEWFKKFEELFQEQKKSNQLALDLPPMQTDRQNTIDTSYLDTHRLVRELQKKILVIRNELQKLTSDSPVQPISENFGGTQKVIDAQSDLLKAARARQKNLEDEKLALVGLLIQIYQERETISQSSSFATVEQIQDDFWEELQFEVSLAPFIAYHYWKSLSNDLRALRWNIQLISRYFQFWLLILLGVFLWRSIRSRTEKLWNMFYSWVRLQKIELVSGKSIQLSTFAEESNQRQKQIIAILPKVVDIVALLIAIIIIKQEHFLIQMLLRGTILVKSWQLVRPFIGIWYPKGELSVKLKRGGFYLVFYLLGIGLLSFVFLELFYAKRAEELLSFFQLILLWVLVFHQLGIWAPIILRRVENIQGLEFFKKIMDRSSNSWIGIRIKSFVGTIIIMIWFFNQLLFFAAEHSQIIGGLIAKSSLQQEELHLEPLSKEDYMVIEQNNSKLMMLQSELSEIKHVFSSWLEDRKRGMIAIVGRRGSGKTELLEHFLESVDGFSIHRMARVRNKKSIIHEFELRYQKQFSNVSEVVSHLRSIESEVICIDNLHHSMFRDVNGYQDIKDILTIMQGTSHHHFWIVVCHYHAWTFLHSPAINVNLYIFRREILIKSKSFQELQHWFMDRAEKTGFQLEFPEVSSMKTEEAKRRYQLAFWRVLADLSNGNPSVAELFWLDSLRKGDEEKTIQMVLYSIPQTETLKGLVDTDYFVLASILLHNGLSIEELQETLQVSFSVVQSSCRNLLGLELIYKQDTRYFIDPRWSSSIEDILVTKRMIYLDV